jgi:hypothetical protein
LLISEKAIAFSWFGGLREWRYCNTLTILKQRHTGERIAWLHRIPTNWERVMTFTSLLSLEQIIAMKDPFAAVEITDADFNRIENIGDLIRHIEILDERRQH